MSKQVLIELNAVDKATPKIKKTEQAVTSLGSKVKTSSISQAKSLEDVTDTLDSLGNRFRYLSLVAGMAAGATPVTVRTIIKAGKAANLASDVAIRESGSQGPLDFKEGKTTAYTAVKSALADTNESPSRSVIDPVCAIKLTSAVVVMISVTIELPAFNLISPLLAFVCVSFAIVIEPVCASRSIVLLSVSVVILAFWLISSTASIVIFPAVDVV